MPEDTFTIAEVFGSHFYALDEEEIAHLYLQEPNYENFYFIGDLILASI